MDKTGIIFIRMISVFGATAFCFSIYNIAVNLVTASVVDMAMFLGVALSFLLFKVGKKSLAKSVFMFVISTFMFVFIIFYPIHTGLYIFTFLLVLISAAIFSKKEKTYRYLFSVYPMVLLALAMSIQPPAFQINLNQLQVMQALTINLFAFAVLFSYLVYQCVSVNETIEHQLISSIKEVEMKNTQLHQSQEQLDLFLYSASHDLRAPISSMKGLINLLQLEKNGHPIAPDYLDMMNRSMFRLEYYISEIIDFSKGVRLEFTPCLLNLNTFVGDVLNGQAYLTGFNKISFTQDIHVKEISGLDKKKLDVILSNLISNAIKYHDLTKETPWVRVTVRIVQNFLEIIVEDNGSGIPKSSKEKIFDIFYRASDKSQGTGLGLYIVRETVRKLGGTIMVESEVGKGTIFTIKLSYTPVKSNVEHRDLAYQQRNSN